MKARIISYAIVFLNLTSYSQTFDWARQIGGTGDAYGASITADINGYVYTTGYFSDSADFNPGSGGYNLISSGKDDIFIQKLDSSGNFVWARRMGNTAVDVSFSIAVDNLGNVYTTGYFMDTVDFDPGLGTYNLIAAGEYDIFVQKLDTGGNFIWAKQIGGSGGDVSNAIALDTLGNVYTTGYFMNTVDFDPGAGTYNLSTASQYYYYGYDIFVLKLDADGNFVWARQMASTSVYGSFNSATSIALDKLGNIFTTGFFEESMDFDPGAGVYYLSTYDSGTLSYSMADMFVQKLDADGNFIWARQSRGYGTEYSESIALDLYGNSYTTGWFNTSTFIGGAFSDSADFDPGAGNYCMTGNSIDEVFILKLDADGNFVWAKEMNGTYSDIGNSIDVDIYGNVYCTGEFMYSSDFDPGIGTYNMTSAGNDDIFIQKLDADGNFVWAKQMGNANVNWGSSIDVDMHGNIYTTGIFDGTVDFDPDSANYNLTSTYSPTGNFDVFIHKMKQPGFEVDMPTSIIENIFMNKMLVYPNPVTNHLTLELATNEAHTISIFNSIGLLVYSGVLASQTTKQHIDVSQLPAGVYMLEVKNNKGEKAIKKVLKM